VYPGLMPLLIPKGVIQVDLGTPSLCLKGASLRHMPDRGFVWTTFYFRSAVD